MKWMVMSEKMILMEISMDPIKERFWNSRMEYKNSNNAFYVPEGKVFNEWKHVGDHEGY